MGLERGDDAVVPERFSRMSAVQFLIPSVRVTKRDWSSGSAPYFVGRLHDEAELGDLVAEGEAVTFHRRRETALGR